MDEYMTVDEVAALLRVSPDTVRYWRHTGAEGPKSFKAGRRVLYARADVEAWITASRDGAVA